MNDMTPDIDDKETDFDIKKAAQDHHSLDISEEEVLYGNVDISSSVNISKLQYTSEMYLGKMVWT